MINFILSIASLILLHLQVLYPAGLLLFGAKPDFLLILIIFLSLYSKNERTFFWAALLGGLKDLLSADLFGVSILSFALISMIMAKVEARFFFRNRFKTLFIFVFCISFLNGLLSYMLHIFFSTGIYPIFAGFKISILQAILTACWSIPLISLLKKCVSRFFISQS
ncbi:MAG: rod shape-determining protein MreD [Candidatus Omnitrophica bacterium]|nr:rod shape-determining protein MreD [Candidatus Omnitrophota bacterium]